MRVHWTKDASADLDRIWFFTANYDVERAERIEALLVAEGDYLARHPTFGRRIDDSGRREWTMVELDYVIRYRIDDDKETLHVLRVWHSRENREG